MQSCKEDLKRVKQQDVDTLTSWTSQICTQAQMRQALTCGKLAVDVLLDAGMTGSAAAADPLLLGASCSSASLCPLLVADGCMTGPASSSARFVEADGADCSACSMSSISCSKSVGYERCVTGHKHKQVEGTNKLMAQTS